MANPQTTCWAMIRAAAQGQRDEREDFARRYMDPVRAYLSARWKDSMWHDLVDDAVQDVFVECFSWLAD
ncbi:MAG: hypothetical protein ACFCD0_19490 [Gemmataceae bacterium]